MLSVLLATVLIIVVGGAVVIFALSVHPLAPRRLQRAMHAKASRFFSAEQQEALSDDLLVVRLEQHVRQERAAVEHFPDQPNPALLRGR